MIQKTAITETNKHKNMRFKLIYNHPFKVPKIHMEIIKGDYFLTDIACLTDGMNQVS